MIINSNNYYLILYWVVLGQQVKPAKKIIVKCISCLTHSKVYFASCQMRTATLAPNNTTTQQVNITPKPIFLLQLLNLIIYTQQCPNHTATKFASKPRPANQFPASNFKTSIGLHMSVRMWILNHIRLVNNHWKCFVDLLPNVGGGVVLEA